jgi:acyl carrier protein phosphodiesterase
VNLLAHALLSGSDTEVRLGNLLADFVKGRDRAAMPPAFLEGVRQHQRIDAFTDSHPLVHRSRARIQGYPHVTGILVDVFYDHFLTLRWDRYSTEHLERFIVRLFAEFQTHKLSLPGEGQHILDHIIEDDWLGSYGTIEGIEETLSRISRRLEARVGKDFALGEAVSELIAHFDDLECDFAEFFPQLQAHVGLVAKN